jgi:hypothetical protein
MFSFLLVQKNHPSSEVTLPPPSCISPLIFLTPSHSLCFFSFLFSFFLGGGRGRGVRDRVSLPGCSGTHSVDQAGLELRNPPASASQVLELKACPSTAQLGFFLIILPSLLVNWLLTLPLDLWLTLFNPVYNIQAESSWIKCLNHITTRNRFFQ